MQKVRYDTFHVLLLSEHAKWQAIMVIIISGAQNICSNLSSLYSWKRGDRPSFYVTTRIQYVPICLYVHLYSGGNNYTDVIIRISKFRRLFQVYKLLSFIVDNINIYGNLIFHMVWRFVQETYPRKTWILSYQLVYGIG